MARHSTHFLIAFLIAGSALAQPVITSTQVVNSASYVTQGSPGSGIAQGSIFTIRGTGLGPYSMLQSSGLPLPDKLGTTTVTVTVGGKSVNAYLTLVYYGYQINALLPSNVPTGNGTVTVTYNNQTSAPEPVQVVSGSFATYTWNQGGSGQAIATDLNYNLNTIINAFHPGDWVILWGTGLGPIAGDDSNKPPVGNIGNPIVHIGNASLSPYYAGRSADYPGLDQVAFQIPSGISGCSVPVAVEINGQVSGTSLLAVSASGKTCTDSLIGQDMVDKLVAGGTVNFGYIQLYAIVLRNSGAPDFAEATFSQFTPQTAGLASYGVSQGYCMTNQFSPDMSPAQLDAGPSISLQGPGTATVPANYAGSGGYFMQLNSNLLWSAEPYTLAGTGGSKVGAFTVNDTTNIPSAYLSGINVNQPLPRSSDLTVTWNGGDSNLQNGQLTIAGFSASSDASVYGYFICTAPVAAKSFTIPKWVLGTLPPTGASQYGFPNGYIWAGQANKPVPFQATGLDKGIMVDEFFNGFPVYYQ